MAVPHHAFEWLKQTSTTGVPLAKVTQLSCLNNVPQQNQRHKVAFPIILLQQSMSTGQRQPATNVWALSKQTKLCIRVRIVCKAQMGRKVKAEWQAESHACRTTTNRKHLFELNWFATGAPQAKRSISWTIIGCIHSWTCTLNGWLCRQLVLLSGTINLVLRQMNRH